MDVHVGEYTFRKPGGVLGRFTPRCSTDHELLVRPSVRCTIMACDMICCLPFLYVTSLSACTNDASLDCGVPCVPAPVHFRNLRVYETSQPFQLPRRAHLARGPAGKQSAGAGASPPPRVSPVPTRAAWPRTNAARGAIKSKAAASAACPSPVAVARCTPGENASQSRFQSNGSPPHARLGLEVGHPPR